MTLYYEIKPGIYDKLMNAWSDQCLNISILYLNLKLSEYFIKQCFGGFDTFVFT